MDEFLLTLGRRRKFMACDGSCLFRAVADFLYGAQARHLEVRLRCVDYIEQNRATYEPFLASDWDLYLFDMRQPKTWGGDMEWTALQQLFGFKLSLFRELPAPHTDPLHAPILPITERPEVCLSPENHIEVCYAGENHYDVVYPAAFFEAAAQVQSLLYEIMEAAQVVPEGTAARSTESGFFHSEYVAWLRDPSRESKTVKDLHIQDRCDVIHPVDDDWREAEIVQIFDNRTRFEVFFLDEPSERHMIDVANIRMLRRLPKGFQYKTKEDSTPKKAKKKKKEQRTKQYLDFSSLSFNTRPEREEAERPAQLELKAKTDLGQEQPPSADVT